MGSSPDEVIEFFQFTSSFQGHQALRFTQPLAEMNIRKKNICGRAGLLNKVDNLTAN
jgi:hypothetical protein